MSTQVLYPAPNLTKRLTLANKAWARLWRLGLREVPMMSWLEVNGMYVPLETQTRHLVA